MREIKVRGYAVEEMIDSQWIYGTGVYKTTFTDEYAKETGKKYEYFIWTEMGWIEVYGESIGECTELSDDNGKEIYEGDVLLYRIWPANRYEAKPIIYHKGNFIVRLDGESEWGDSLWDCTVAGCEVIGNIFEHSHLLEQHHD